LPIHNIKQSILTDIEKVLSVLHQLASWLHLHA
jgi:hypothetical protein